MIQLTKLYYAKKKWDAFWGDPNAEAVTANPVSKPDPEVMALGILGAQHGAADHAAYKVKKSPPLWRPVSELVGGDSVYAKSGTAYQG